ncbi:glucose-6-phosphate isomerase [Rickettsiella grylli]|uniref:Glucose-6-phosphate isomerase n=1 Tax=Rickettsiella grylli TaxID=59196 RepID=A8PNS4_9COXI|nr:glucose-6-phosphate isomerase [Rickettsiella grylli]EDP46662.1 glucose-6-phosphate isomerase [Rickettsiella grylli]
MNGAPSRFTHSDEWKNLKQHASDLKKIPLTELFLNDPFRAKTFSLTEKPLTVDYSKNPILEKTLTLLIQLADRLHLKQKINDLFQGACVNTTQHLPALHTALRNPHKKGLLINGEDILVKIHTNLDKMQQFVDAIHQHRWRGWSGKKITDIIHLGIGGSDLGPRMVVHALKKTWKENSINLHFISPIDDSLSYLIKKINLETSLFIITSKSFRTHETLSSATQLFKHFQEKYGAQSTKRHFLAVTHHIEKAIAFGIDPAHIFPLWNWVGGRYSLWSAVGLPIALAVGMSNFRTLLQGAYTMDQHFLNQPWRTNLPVILGLLGVWQVNFFQTSAHAILPYDTRLHYLPAYLQQLEMESNGKSISIHGKPIDYATCPIIFGAHGLNAQHTFYQLFHQGTAHFSADFICTLRDPSMNINDHRQVISSVLSQSKVFMEGYVSDNGYQCLPGNHANTILALNELNPFSLGLLIALYEHKVFVQSVIWQINPFDQWGVEYGKQLNKTIYQQLNNTDTSLMTPLDSSTRAFIERFQTLNCSLKHTRKI